MTSPASAPRPWRTFWIALGILGVVLAWLWRDSFDPRMAALANDAPLGMMSAYSEFRWSNFWNGSWSPLVWIGGPALPLQPAFNHGLYLLAGPIAFAKFAAPVSMLLLGLGAVVFSRQQGFAPAVSILTGLAAALNLNFLSHASWGLGVRAAAAGFTLLALAALSKTEGRRGWLGAVLAGVATGYVVVEGADSGALMTVFIAAYALFAGSLGTGRVLPRVLASIRRLAVVVGFSVWVAAYALSALIGTQIQGVAGMGEDAAAREQRWQFVSGLSFPKLEVVRMAIPGIMGIRSVSPGEELYWGSVGGDISPPRFNGGGEYAGVLVLILAGWAVARTLARSGRQPFTDRERKLIGFWAVTALVTLLLSFGHYAPFYQVVFALPYFSTIRGPMKFLHLTHLALIILFAYGLQGLWRLYVESPVSATGGTLKKWWGSTTGFERCWAWTLVGLTGGAAAFGLIYASFQPALVEHLAGLGFTGSAGRAMAAFSVREVGFFAVTTAASGLLLAFLAAGRFAGRPGWAGGLLGILLVADLARAATPFVLHYNYQRRYEPNVVTDFLRQKPWEHRVVARPHPVIRSTFSARDDGTWPAVHNQWLEHQMPFNEIQTLDIWQMPRRPELDEAMLEGFGPKTENDLAVVGRLWDLANVRYVLGARGFEEILNQQFAGGSNVFKPVLVFGLTAKAGLPTGAGLTLDDITAVADPAGQYAVFENTRALPRARFFTRWETIPNDSESLARLKSPDFDPATSVILSSAVSLSPGVDTEASATATISQWQPKRITVQTDSPSAGILLLNERWHPDWKVTVDDQPAELLRANFIMRGVAVPAGQHTVVFQYAPPMRMLWVTLSALLVALGLTVWLAWGPSTRESAPEPSRAPAPKPPAKRSGK